MEFTLEGKVHVSRGLKQGMFNDRGFKPVENDGRMWSIMCDPTNRR